MPNRTGLKKVTKTVRGKKGSVRRSYWVRAKEAAKGVGRVAWKHKGKIATGVAVAGGLYLTARAYNAGSNFRVAYNWAKEQHQDPSWLKHPPKHWKHVVDRYNGAARRKEQQETSERANAQASWQRQDAHNSGRAPLHLESGPTPRGRSGQSKPKTPKTPKKKSRG